MTKAKEQPEITKVPWSVPAAATNPPSNEDAQSQGEQESEQESEQSQNEEVSDPTQIDRARASFSGDVVAQRSPFAPKPKNHVEEETVFYELGDAPGWTEFVNFVRKHGNLVHQVRHPQPKGSCIDTMWKGVPVHAAEKCELHHIQYGWVNWADAQYE